MEEELKTPDHIGHIVDTEEKYQAVIKDLNKKYEDERICPVCNKKKTGGPPKRWRGASMFEKEEAIYNCLIQHPDGLMTTEIGRKIDMWYNYVSRIIDVMHIKGKVKFKPVGRGRLIKPVLKKSEQKERNTKFKEENKDEVRIVAPKVEEEKYEEEIIPLQRETNTLPKGQEEEISEEN